MPQSDFSLKTHSRQNEAISWCHEIRLLRALCSAASQLPTGFATALAKLIRGFRDLRGRLRHALDQRCTGPQSRLARLATLETLLCNCNSNTRQVLPPHWRRNFGEFAIIEVEQGVFLTNIPRGCRHDLVEFEIPRLPRQGIVDLLAIVHSPPATPRNKPRQDKNEAATPMVALGPTRNSGM